MIHKNRRKIRTSLVFQVSIFFLIGCIMTVSLSYVTLKTIADKNVVREKESLSSGIATDVERSIKEYSSYKWVLNYLIVHQNDELDLEYESSVETDKKIADLIKRHDGMILAKTTQKDLEHFSKNDQKLFAEIVFNRWLNRLNDLKQSYGVSYLYFLAADDTYEKSIFLVSASDGKMVRGSEPGDAYVLGTTVQNTADQNNAFKKLKSGNDYVVYSDEFMDRYRYLFRIGNMNTITGMTFEISNIKKDVESQALQSVFSFSLLQIILSVFCLLLIYIFALKPLKKVKMNVYDYADTKDSERVRKQLSTIRSKNEIGALADGFSKMIKEIDAHLERIKTITVEQERISAELNVATQIQTDMLPNIFPPFPDISEFDIYASMNPAKEVGGDFYDFFMVDDKHIALVMADVSGKGVPAALFMVIAKTLIKNRTLLGGTPSDILGDVNNQIYEGNASGFFVTVWMAIIDIDTGKGIAANAGHEHPVLYRAGGRYELVKYRHSPAVSVMKEMQFKEHEFELHPGDRIFVYTDGVPEATNSNDQFYGVDRMLAVLNREPDAKLDNLIGNLEKDIEDFVGEAIQFDDITMLAFTFNGKDECLNGKEE